MNQRKSTGLSSAWGLILVAVLAACGSDSSNGQTVTVNLSLLVDARQALHQSIPSRVFAWIERWFPGATPAWAQAVTDIASIQVEITGPGIAVPATTTVPVSDPTNGQQIPVSIQAPVGANRTITVSAFNAASPPRKIFGGTLPNVNLTAGAPIDLEITLVRLFTVTVNKEGEGSGTVTSSPGGINCDPACATQAQQFQEGTTVSLNAAAAPGSTFAGWSGACSGTAACTITNNATVTARFNVAVSTDQLTVNLAGTGTVTSNPSGISCPGTCAAEFATGTTVTLTATPTNGSTFTGWSGGGCTGTGPCVVAIVGDQTVTATFTAAPVLFTLTVTKAGAGAGTVSSDPPGITACATTCSANFAPGTVVTLTATPQSGSTFVGWGGACSGTGSCQVTMDANRSVTATFDPPISLSVLTLQKTGTGVGTVTSSPAGIDCGPTCVASFATGSTVTLTAIAAPGSTFVGWTAGPCTGTQPCPVVMSTAQTVVAQFDPIVVPPDLVTLTVGKQGQGDGTVTSSPAGINCGLACMFSYQRGTAVTLTAVPDGDSSFNDWHGGPCDNSSSPTCQLVMDDNQTVSAHFDDDD